MKWESEKKNNMAYDVKIYFEVSEKAKPKFTLTIDTQKQFSEIIDALKTSTKWFEYGPICCRKKLIMYMVCEER